MKTLHVFHHTDLLNGVDRTTLTLMRALLEQGVSVQALVPHEGDVTQALDALGVPYKLANLVCCGSSAKMAELRYLGLAAERAHMLAEWMGEACFDLVHLNTGHLIDGGLAAAIAGVPALWHIHAPFEVDQARYGFAQPEAYAWLLSTLGDHVIAVSDDVRKSPLHHLPADKVSALFNGIDTADLRARALAQPPHIRKALGLAADTPLVLGVGRISAQKDFATFVRVAEQVVKHHATVCFAIAGPAEDQPLAEALAEQIASSRLSRRVFLLGPRQDIPGLLAESNAFLSTAIFEGHPLTSLEAMALQKPVVAMDCVGLRECIRHGVDGVLVPLGDVAACAQAVLGVLNGPGHAQALAHEGALSVEARFSAQAYALGFLTIAQKVIAQYPPRHNAGAAHMVLGLLDEIRFAHDRLVQLSESPTSLGGKLRKGLAKLGIGDA